MTEVFSKLGKEKNPGFFYPSLLKETRKGDVNLLAPETLKIIVALLCLLILVGLLIKLYYIKVNSEKFQQAEAVLLKSDDSIRGIIDKVREEKTSYEKLIHFPKGWYFFSFVGSDLKPNSCAGENCLCICDNVGVFSITSPLTNEAERQALECDENGVCLVVKDLRRFKEIKITDPTSILIKYDKGIIIEEK